MARCNKFVVATEEEEPEVIEREVSLVRVEDGVEMRVDDVPICMLRDEGEEGPSDLLLEDLSRDDARDIGVERDGNVIDVFYDEPGSCSKRLES